MANYKRTSKIPEGKRGSRVHSKTWKVIICTNKKDLELRQKIKDAGFSFSTSTERTVIKHHICSKDLVEKLIPFGKGAKGKKIPDYVFSISVEKKEALFRGWVDADGCTTKGRIQATTISKDLAEGMARIARSVFKRPVAIYKTEVPLEKKIEGRLVNQNTQYSVRVSKKPHGFCDDNYCWVPFREAIKVDRNLTVYNLEVKEDNSYVANGFAVHNCQDISIAGKGAGLDGERSGLWFEYARIIDELRPRYAVMENVGALTIRGIDSVLGSLAEIGYACEWQDIRASDVGAPHRRERIWIVAYAEQNGLSAD